MDLIIRHFDGRPDETYNYPEILTLTPKGNKETRDIVFVTGNQYKVAELGEHIKSKHATLTILDLDLIEIQDSDALNIVQEKCKRAYEKVNKLPNHTEQTQSNRSVLIEDVSLNFNAMNGMPGPYIKSFELTGFLEAVGPKGLHKMLEGFRDKSAEAICTYALMDDESSIVFCRGSVRGKITSPRGSSWGWDPVFEEERSSMTFAEMDSSMKSKFSHRSNAITVLKKYLEAR